MKNALIALLLSLGVVTSAGVVTHVAIVRADEIAAQASSTPTIQAKLEAAGRNLEDLGQKIPLEGVTMLVAGLVYDFARRRIRSAKPASLVRDFFAIVKGIKRAAVGLVALLAKADEFGDRLLGQRTVEPPKV